MRKTNNETNISNAITVNIDALAERLGCGKNTAKKIAEESGARVQIGKRVLYSVKKIEEYIYANAK